MAHELDSPMQLAHALAPLAQRHLRRSLGRRNERALPSVLLGELRQQFPGQRHVEFARGLPADDPLRRPLIAWSARLTEARVNAAWQAEDERLAREVSHVVKEPEERRASLEELLDESRSCALALGAGDARTRSRELIELRLRQVAEHAPALSEHRRGESRRVLEIRERLGLVGQEAEFAIETESADSALGAGSSSAQACESLALRALQECAEMLAALPTWGERSSWTDLLEGLAGAGLTEGWPARLAPDTLQGMMRISVLARGVSVPDFALPERLCPSSFARAAHRWGRALRQQLVSRDLPLCWVGHPDDFDGHLFGHFFSEWVVSENFARRVRGRSKADAADERRHRARLACSQLAVAALRALLNEWRLAGQLTAARYGEVTEALLGAPRPWSAVLVELSVRPSERARFCALLSAQTRIRQLTEEFDEDWLVSPRAQEKLREEARGPATATLHAAEVEAGLEVLLARMRRDWS